MRSLIVCLAAPVLAALSAPAAADSAVVEFTFTSTIGGNGSSVPGTSEGDPIAIVITAQSGSESLADRRWRTVQHQNTRVEIGGGAYVVDFHGGGKTFSATTNAAGDVSSIEFADVSASNSDTLGSDTLGIFINGARNIFFADSADADAVDLTTPENWTVAVVD